VVFLPFLNGERTPNLPHGRASISGLSAANISRANIARAALEAAIFGLRGGLEAFKALGFNAREIRVTGGGAMSALWRQMAADIMNLPVKRPSSAEGAAMGAAVQALWCLLSRDHAGKPVSLQALCDEHIELEEKDNVIPDPRNVAEYDKAYQEYKKYLNTLSVLYR
jgi:xylulokinase